MNKITIKIVFPLALLLALCISSSLFADENKSLVSVSGTYGTAIGFTTDKFLWKDANADYQEKNFRYIFSDPTVNMYDKRIFDRYECEIKTDTHTPWNAYADIKIDPWAFTGIGKETIYSTGGDQVVAIHKYWENTGLTINDTYSTLQGKVVRESELKVLNNRVCQDIAIGPSSLGSDTFVFSKNNSSEIDHFFRPVRKGWIEYKEDPLTVKVFPISDQSEALSTDDPLRLSNNHVNYAPSPWTFVFDPGMQQVNGTIASVKRAQWNWDLAWFAEDSNRQYLTYLRGISLSYKLGDKATIDSTIASPMTPWDYYETISSVPWATRFKFNPTDRLMIGATLTSKFGIYKQEMRATNQVLGFDFNYTIAKDTDLYGECAGSYMFTEESDRETWRTTDTAFKAGLKSRIDLPLQSVFNWDISAARMGSNFAPGLSDYRDTREDQDWGRHIWFEDTPKDSEWYRIGDGIDVGRYVMGIKARTTVCGELFDLNFSWRNVNSSYNNKFIENITRFEPICNPMEHLQLKGLFLLRNYPHTLGGLDPIIRDRYTDQPLANDVVTDGQDANLMTFGGGAKVDCCDNRVVLYANYEATNDPQNFPRSVLNDLGRQYVVDHNILYGDNPTFLYRQNLFSLPNYQFYNLWKGCVVVRPVDKLSIKFTHVTNTNRYYAALIDNNQNQDSIEVTVTPYERATFRVGYSVSRIIDLKRALDTNGADRQFNAHSNVYAQFRLQMKNESRLVVQFGEAWLPEAANSVYGVNYVDTNTAVLDTQSILRIFYEGKF